ncbi:vacuolar fusion protein mon1 [Boeremia exigua]|uniref:vacuolar fusion protein mon1 n=1 Tax=Boeremia exigua TaxID=749465 RepID=UPI001E8E2CD5|nr:vacuolar fusion protein mon1 [Boeremia exigua]KAH6637694.1 vacuolar fusion protein mon1 [Boeremia exigua]
MSESGKAEPPRQPSPSDAPSNPTAAAADDAQPPQHSSEQRDGAEQVDFANPTLSVIGNASRSPSYSGATSPSREGTPPPLPPRPRPQLGVPAFSPRPASSHSVRHAPSRPQLVSKATTQLSFTNTQAFGSDPWDDSASPASSKPRHVRPRTSSNALSDASDSASLRSYAPTIAEAGGESILGEVMGATEKSKQEETLLRALGHRFEDSEAQSMFPPDPAFESSFDSEFEDVDDMAADGSNEEQVMRQWRAKLKHFLILSSAGKPIYSRHGDDQLITNYIGVVQTIISFYQSTKDTLRGFTAGDVRFVVMSKGPLNLVAITRLAESDAQLRTQLEALYMQILSTLTLPSMERMFAARANYDLRRPLQGTETLLSALADGFTRGSPSTLLSALECLKLRKSHRNTINNTLLKTRSDHLLYGLIVASGKLVSVVRPKKHSLHPGDLHLIFNMLFEAGSVKAGGGENWIPLCLPGFNNTGYLYMYVSFLNLQNPGEQMEERPRTRDGGEDEVAVLLISADKESFFEMRRMRDNLVECILRPKART